MVCQMRIHPYNHEFGELVLEVNRNLFCSLGQGKEERPVTRHMVAKI